MKTTDQPVSIFLVDDDNMFLSSLTHSLNQKLKSKVKISSFASGEECLKELDHDPDIVVLDYYLNSENVNAMNGVQVLKKIRSEKNEAPVIMLSTEDKVEVVSDSFKNGAFEYVVKNESFLARMENMIKNMISNIDIQRKRDKYERWNYIIGTSLVLFLVLDMLYYIFH